MFPKALLCFLALLLPCGVLAAVDDKVKLANRTIDRVRIALAVCGCNFGRHRMKVMKGGNGDSSTFRRSNQRS